MSSLFHCLATAAACACLCSCVSIDMADEENRAEVRASAVKVLDARKKQSLRFWRDHRLEGEKAEDYVAIRTSLLLCGQVDVVFQEVAMDTERGVGSAKMLAKLKGKSVFAAACAISADGYYLTAAHCADTEPLFLLVGDERGPRKVRARLVWRSLDEKPDLALLHAPVSRAAFFPLAQPESISSGSKVITDGYGSFKSNPAGGKILKHSVERFVHGETRWLEFHHDAPFVMGDSGGPVVDEKARLLGVGSAIQFNYWRVLGRPFLCSYRCRAFSADPDWIASLIAEDRKRSGRSR